MESISKTEYHVRGLKTRSVTLYPTRAQICREVKNVPLQPGTNEITITGLSPTVDEQSIKVEGSGSAIISDIAVESLPNRDIFEEVYPEFEQDNKSQDNKSQGDAPSDGEGEGEEEAAVPEGADLLAARNQVKDLLDLLRAAEESEKSAARRQENLDSTTVTLTWEHKIDVEETMDSVSRARDKLATRRIEAARRQRELAQPLAKARAQADRLEKLHRRAKARATQDAKRARNARNVAKLQEARREQERLQDKARRREELEAFWPRHCYAVRIQLVANTATPSASRRTSVGDVDVDMGVESEGEARTVDLVLSYVTTAASWTPSYDLQLSTTNATGTLCFDARVSNKTSETWDRCKVTLATSLAAASGLGETTPKLEPWRLGLASSKGGKAAKASTDQDDKAVLFSREEKLHKARATLWAGKPHSPAEKPRSHMFGVGPLPVAGLPPRPPPPNMGVMASHPPGATINPALLMGTPKLDPAAAELRDQQMAAQLRAQQLQRQQMQEQARQQMMMQQQQQQQSMQMMQVQQMPQRNIQNFLAESADGNANANSNSSGDGRNSMVPSPEPGSAGSDLSQLDFEESAVEETGFSTSYDLPGLKTLCPRMTPSRQRVARLGFSGVHFCHTVVPKLRAAAFLSAKMANSSRLTLQRGPVGVTLDGSFMGRTTLPKCVAGGSVELGLGVDPALRVGYAAPEVRRATSGYFTKEDIKLYARTIRVENTRSGSQAPAKLVVSDQVPLSDAEGLRVEVLQPQGLVVGAEAQPAGESGGMLSSSTGGGSTSTEGEGEGEGEVDDSWGTAKAHLRKTGTVDWLVVLQPGKSVKLGLEYLVATPLGSHAKQS